MDTRDDVERAKRLLDEVFERMLTDAELLVVGAYLMGDYDNDPLRLKAIPRAHEHHCPVDGCPNGVLYCCCPYEDGLDWCEDHRDEHVFEAPPLLHLEPENYDEKLGVWFDSSGNKNHGYVGPPTLMQRVRRWWARVTGRL